MSVLGALLGNALQSALAELRELSNQVTATAEQAMELSLRGKSAAAVQLLLQAGEQSLNGKLLEMTGALVRRHAAALVDGAELSARAAELMNRCCLPVSHIAGIQRTGRSPGGLRLRLRSAATSWQRKKQSVDGSCQRRERRLD